MSVVFVLLAILLITIVALLSSGRLGELPAVSVDRAPLALPESGALVSEDIDALRFAVGTRGYRMDEVDAVLDRLATEADNREVRIAELETRLIGRGVPRPDPADYEV